MSVARTSVLAGGVLGLVGTLLALAPVGSAAARGRDVNPLDHARFAVDRGYRGDFPDPAVLRVGRTYYAYSTTISSLNMPVMTSTDLVHWQARGEAQERAAAWALQRRSGGRTVATTWAPSVIRVGRTYTHAYATPVRGAHPRKMCISVSRSLRPASGFADRTRRPLICPSSRGAIDPQYVTVPGGARYLLWKSEQTRRYKAQILITRVNRNGTRLIYPSRRLLVVQDAWERGIIENPAMIRYHGRYYLFYSGGSWDDGSYATGYAICRTVLGPCFRASSRPLLATGGRVSGPGGATVFYDGVGRLRMAYAAWDRGHTGYPTSSACHRRPAGCNQRRLHVATLTRLAAGSAALRVVARG